MVKSLEELKRENAESESTTEEQTAAVQEEIQEEAAEVETEENAEPAVAEQSDAEETEVEAWMLAEEQAPANDGGFTGSDIAAAKRKLRSKLTKQHESETAALKAEIDSLKAQMQGGVAPQAQASTQEAMPTLESCDYDDVKHQQAVAAWVDKRISNQSQQTQQQQQQQQVATQLTEAVDSHYERAAKLSSEQNISPELYQQSDLAVRQAIGSDEITDQLIARIGEGSEKVMYYLGRNPAARENLRSKLQSDPTGLSAMIMLGELKGQIATPSKKTSKARPPAKRADGGAAPANVGEKMKREYGKADLQGRISIKRKAKAEGVDTSNW